jgi:hypothetical protein
MGDLMMDGGANFLIGKECVLLKVTKAGLYQVALASDQRRFASVPKRNVDFVEDKDAQA